jgi:uncharacterized membrane protein YbjE (DUF340 family)
VSVFLLISSTVVEFAVAWWFITREYRRSASLRRFLSWLVLTLCLLFSPFFQISMIRQIVAQRELPNTISYAWVILVGLCALAFMFTILRNLGNKGDLSGTGESKNSRP